MTTEIIFFLFCMILSAVFSAMETAFTSLSTEQIESVASQWKKKGLLIRKIMNQPERMLGSVLIGNNVANVTASVLATRITLHYFGESALGIMTGVLTFIILTFCEIIPKQSAIAANEFTCRHSIYPLYFLSIVLRPITAIFSFTSRFLLKNKGTQTLTLQGVLQTVSRAEQTGLIDQYRSAMLHNTFHLSRMSIDCIMTHRRHVFSLEKLSTLKEALPHINASSFSLIPLYDKNPENIVGILEVKTLLKHLDDTNIRLHKFMKPPLFMSHNKKVHQVLHQMLKKEKYMSIILDEYGGLDGIVTMNDIFEEITGESTEKTAPKKIVKLDDHRFSIRGNIPLEKMSSFLPQPLIPTRHAQTLGGYLCRVLGRLPTQNEKIITPVGIFTVTHLVNYTIERVLYEKTTNKNED